MSEEHLALARKAIDALNRGDFDALWPSSALMSYGRPWKA
jgi:hypothetical protein